MYQVWLDAFRYLLLTNEVSEAKKEEEVKEKRVEGETALSQLKWVNIFLITWVHLMGFYGFYLLCYYGKLGTVLSTLVIGWISGFGVTGGAHRYYTHRTYKATKPLQILLLTCYSMAGQNPMFHWVRDHRVHHKFSETDADPHNSNRGLFFSHVGWLMMKKHPDVVTKGKAIDMSDIVNDPYIKIHTRYFIPMQLFWCFILPTAFPMYLFGETFKVAFFSNLFRYTATLNITWSVNSFAHIYGFRPYDRRIRPAQNKSVALLALGEGWHNYHHVFPWDYRASEHGYNLNTTMWIIDKFAQIGWAYDLKKPTPQLIKSVVDKYGSLEQAHHHPHHL